MRAAVSICAALALTAFTAIAWAHQTSVVYVDVAVHGRIVDVETRIGSTDLYEPLGVPVGTRVTESRARASAERVAWYVRDRFDVRNGGVLCPSVVGPTAVRPRADGFTLAAALRYTCGRQVDDLEMRYQLFFDVDPRHQGMAEIQAFGTTQEHTFRDADRVVHITGQPSRVAQFFDYLAMGIEHIFTGYDHIAFLFSLLIIAGSRGARRGLRYALGVVTAFTLAHSITLACAALGIIRLPSRFIESAIAISILYVAVENVIRPVPRARWLLTFAFGLIHGFGFASVLGELGLPRRGLVLCLVGFNLGVEVGQLLVVSVAFPLLLLIHRARWRTLDIAAALALTATAFIVLSQFAVPRDTLAVVVFGGTLALAVASRRFGYDRGVRIGASLTIAAFATLWLIERASMHVIARGILG